MNIKPKRSSKPILKVTNLNFRYPEQSTCVLTGVNLKLYPHELRVIVGLSGSGKSTLLNALCGFIPHSIEGELEGEIRLGNQDLRDLNIYEIARYISLVQQDPEAQLCTNDVFHELAFALENFKVPVHRIRSRVSKILTRFNLQHLRNRSIHELSGGEKQKVAIASMLVLKPKVLVFDEPTASLDPSSTHEFIEFIDNLRRESDVGILIVDHNPSEYIHVADHILVLANGGIRHVLRSHQFKEFHNNYYNKIFQHHQTMPNIRHPKQLEFSNNVKNSTQRPSRLPGGFHGSKDGENKQLLEIRNLNFKYNSIEILKNINLKITHGEFIGLMGDNGSGKTTLIQNILHLLKPNKGLIIYSFNGTKIYKRTTAELAANIGYVFQNPNHMIFGNTVWEEVMIGPKNFNQDKRLASKSAIELLKLGGLNQHRSVHPFLLSHGEKRRLNLSSILCYGPDLIILDEPFIGQDPENISKILEYLQNVISLGKTVIMATHRADIVYRCCNRVLFLKKGRLILDAPIRAGFERLASLGERSYLNIFHNQ
ncbi:ABC transporter ATP-binding protein [[Eubacterium] cellulosolvens]